ncbi:MAG: cytochrome P450 [Granulosicoccus sp.]
MKDQYSAATGAEHVSVRQGVQKLDLSSAHFQANPAPTWHALHRKGPLVTSRLPLLGRIALATHYGPSLEILRDTDQFSVDARHGGHKQSAGMRWWVPSVFRPLATNLLTVEGSEHRELRRRVDFAFRRSRLTDLKPDIENLAGHCIDNFLQAIAVDGQADFVTHVARPLPQRVISRLLGLSSSSTESDSHLNRALSVLGGINGPVELFRAVPAIRIITRVISTEIARRRADPREDLLSELVAEAGEGRALTNEEISSLVFLLYVAGHETTTHLLSTSVHHLLSHADLIRQLDNPVRSNMIHEFVRYLSPVQMTKPRFVRSDIDFHGVKLRRGETVSVLIGAANRDPHVFDNPDDFDLHRGSSRHLGFGTGAHTCLGLQLALLETATTLNELFHHSPELTFASGQHSAVWRRRLGLRALDSLLLSLA